MDRETAKKLVRMGLEQIPTDGLGRLAQYMDANGCLLLNGLVYSADAGFG